MNKISLSEYGKEIKNRVFTRNELSMEEYFHVILKPEFAKAIKDKNVLYLRLDVDVPPTFIDELVRGLEVTFKNRNDYSYLRAVASNSSVGLERLNDFITYMKFYDERKLNTFIKNDFFDLRFRDESDGEDSNPRVYSLFKDERFSFKITIQIEAGKSKVYLFKSYNKSKVELNCKNYGELKTIINFFNLD